MTSTFILLLTTVIISTSVGVSYNRRHNLTSIPPEAIPGDTTIQIRYVTIKRIEEDAFISYSNLRWIYMEGCGVEYIEEGAFRGLEKLRTLELYGSSRTLILPPNLDPIPKSLVRIMFFNTLADQTATAYPYFKAFENLHELNIGISYLNIRDVDILPNNLTSLLASWNYMRIFPSLGIHTPLLQFLYLSTCTISSVPVENIAGLTDLKVLSLRYNHIPNLPDISFMKDLEELDLYWNKLTTLPDLYELPLKTLHLGANNLVCDKSLCWIRMWPWMKASIIPSDAPTCKLPPTMVQMKLMDVDPALMECFRGESRPDIWLHLSLPISKLANYSTSQKLYRWFAPCCGLLGVQKHNSTHINLGPGLLRNFHVKLHVSQLRFSNLASDWLTAQLTANQKPC